MQTSQNRSRTWDSPKEKRYGWIDLLAISGTFLLLAPILSMHRVTDFMIFCIFVLSFDLLYGYMGRLSFGHLLFLGTGAYWCGLFVKYISTNPLFAILAGIIAAGLMGMVLGLIVIRTTGACFALINMAFNCIGFFLVLSPLRKFTSGEDGFGVNATKLYLLDLNSPLVMFVFVLFCLLLVFSLLKRITSSPYGIMVRSIKEDENRTRFLGYNTYVYKWITFILSGSMAGLAGTLTALNYNFVSPSVMEVHSNLGVIFASMIGGAGNLYGAIVGGVIYMVISNFLPLYLHHWEMFLGFCILIITFRFREGIWGYLMGLWGLMTTKRLQRKLKKQGLTEI